jgi:imidazolonepropionase-like amidohydrolase
MNVIAMNAMKTNLNDSLTRAATAVASGLAAFGLTLAIAAATPATTFAQTVAITGGKVYPVSGPPIENATVVIVDGKITAVGANVTVPAGATTVDAKGKWVTPGLINGATALGLVEVGADPGSNDARAKGDHNVAAAFRAWEGLNAGSVMFSPARNAGITTAVSLPSGGMISGQAAAIDTVGATAKELVRKAPVAMVANLGSAQAADATARGELFLRFREVLEDAKDYATKKLAYERAATREFAVGKLHLEALQPVIGGKMLLLVAADRASDIETALDIAAEYKLRIAILGGAEAWKVADKLAAAKVAVLTAGLDNLPTSFATLGSRQENAGLLRKANVPVAMITTEGDAFKVRTIKQHAGNAVAYGMTWDDALRAVTLTPAEIFGIDGAVGSLAIGKDGNVVVWDGDPFEFATRAEKVFIKGKEVQGPGRQEELTERYKTPSAIKR